MNESSYDYEGLETGDTGAADQGHEGPGGEGLTYPGATTNLQDPDMQADVIMEPRQSSSSDEEGPDHEAGTEQPTPASAGGARNRIRRIAATSTGQKMQQRAKTIPAKLYPPY